ncbi:MAG: VOC family protein [Pseudomonadota bacterium]
MNRAFVNILTEDVAATAQFYQELLGMRRTGDFGWFVILSHETMPHFELGILERDHDTIPNGVSAAPQGFISTFVVEDVEEIYARALKMDAEIIEKPTELPYGQRRLMLRDPAGAAVDVSAPIR